MGADSIPSFRTEVLARAEEGTVVIEEEVEIAQESVGEGKRARQRIRREEVWREIVKSSNGRDKALVNPHTSFPLKNF